MEPGREDRHRRKRINELVGQGTARHIAEYNVHRASGWVEELERVGNEAAY